MKKTNVLCISERKQMKTAALAQITHRLCRIRCQRRGYFAVPSLCPQYRPSLAVYSSNPFKIIYIERWLAAYRSSSSRERSKSTSNSNSTRGRSSAKSSISRMKICDELVPSNTITNATMNPHQKIHFKSKLWARIRCSNEIGSEWTQN